MAYDAAEDLIKHYRVDKMQKITANKEPRMGKERFKEFDMAKYAKRVFGMYTGEETDVVIQGENNMVGVLIDRFGKDIPIIALDDDYFEAKVNVALSPQFLGWIMSLGKGIRITGPEPVVDRMKQEIQRLKDQYA